LLALAPLAGLLPSRAGEEERGSPLKLIKAFEASLAAVEEVRVLDLEGDMVRPGGSDPILGEVRNTARALALHGSTKAVSALLDHLLDEYENPFYDEAVYTAIRSALSDVELPSGVAFLLGRMRTDKSWERRVALTYVARLRRDAGIDEALLGMLRDREPEVALAAIRALGMRRSVEAAKPLAQLLEEHAEERDRPWLEARQSLNWITGTDFDTGGEWRRYIAERGATLAANTPEPTLWKPPLDAPASHRVVIILDVSSSMRLRDPLPETAGAEEKPAEHTEARPGAGASDGLPEERGRLARAKQGIAKLLLHLHEDARFDLIRFAQHPSPWRGSLVPVSEDTIARAVDYLRGYTPMGLSRADLALEEGFRNREADTIYFFSDGIPSRAQGAEAAEFASILAQVRVWNRFRGVRIHTVGFGSVDGAFLRFLARENGGAYYELD
jgi:hypothetical protein